jgi:flagellar protein FliL
MAAAAQSVASDGNAPAKSGGKKILVVVVALLVVLAIAGGGAVWLLNKQRQDAQAAMDDEEAGDDSGHEDRPKRAISTTPPAYMALDPFVVNLADRDSERFAQIGITLELDDASFGERVKAYMPAIRNGILMVLAHKESKELLTRAGKEQLAGEIMREVLRPLGIELEDPDAEGGEKRSSRRGRIPVDKSPVRHVHFSSFIIQ